MSEYLSMGGYGFYVWTSYALTAVVLTANVLRPWLAERALRQTLARKLRLARRNA